MTKELAKTLTTALVRFIDKQRPEGSICCSNAECESIEKMFEGDKFDIIEAFMQKKLSRLTEFEMAIHRRLNLVNGEDLSATELLEETKGMAAELLDLAREQFIKDGYVIEKKAFHDAVEKVPPEVMKEVSDNVDKEDELAKKYLEGYTQGYKDAEKKYNESVAYRNPTMPTTPSDFGCDGIRCTNPHMDCICCPRRSGVMYNTTSGTSTGTLHGNTSATDGKEYNPSFTD